MIAFSALRVELRNDGAGAIDFLLFRQEERRRAHLENVHDLGGNPVEQLHHVAGFEQTLAERVQLLDVALARGSIRGLLPGARRKAAGKNGDHQKGDQRHPILRIGDRESCPPAGGKSKLNASMATTDMATETAMPQMVETAKMDRRNVSATVVALTEGSTRR